MLCFIFHMEVFILKLILAPWNMYQLTPLNLISIHYLVSEKVDVWGLEEKSFKTVNIVP